MPGIQRVSHPTPNNLSPTISSPNSNGNNSSSAISSVAVSAGTVSPNVLPHIIIQSQPQHLLHSSSARSSANTAGTVNQLSLMGNQSACLSTSLPSLQQQLKQNIITVHAIAPNTMAITTHANVNTSHVSSALFTPSSSSTASLTMTSLPLTNNTQYSHTMARTGQHCLYATSNSDFLQNRNNSNVLGSTASINHQSLTQVISSAAMVNTSQSSVDPVVTVVSSSAGTPVTIHSSQNAILEYLENTTKM